MQESTSIPWAGSETGNDLPKGTYLVRTESRLLSPQILASLP